MDEAPILRDFAEIVAKSLQIDPASVTPDAYLDELGAESLDLIEITMEAETRFNISLPEKSILDTANQVFGPKVLEEDGHLTEEGKRLMMRRMPAADAVSFSGDVTVKDLQHYFMKVSTWVRMLATLMEHTPRICPACGGALKAAAGLRMLCPDCGKAVEFPPGEEINRKWVQEYYEKEYLPRLTLPAEPCPVQ